VAWGRGVVPVGLGTVTNSRRAHSVGLFLDLWVRPGEAVSAVAVSSAAFRSRSA
jgi:hypothetical protein